MARTRALIVLLCASVVVPASSSAQRTGARIELRGDGIISEDGGFHFGVGLVSRLSTYTRSAVIAGAGPGSDGATARVEAALRFHTDPMRARRWGSYLSAGAGVMFGDDPEPFILALAGVERSRPRGWTPAIEAGFGRGVRVALVLRRARGALR